jgi:hypothetical protein
MMGFAELGARSNFSFLDGVSDPAELVQTAAALGLAGLGIRDTNSLAGVVRGRYWQVVVVWSLWIEQAWWLALTLMSERTSPAAKPGMPRREHAGTTLRPSGAAAGGSDLWADRNRWACLSDLNRCI